MSWVSSWRHKNTGRTFECHGASFYDLGQKFWMSWLCPTVLVLSWNWAVIKLLMRNLRIRGLPSMSIVLSVPPDEMVGNCSSLFDFLGASSFSSNISHWAVFRSSCIFKEWYRRCATFACYCAWSHCFSWCHWQTVFKPIIWITKLGYVPEFVWTVLYSALPCS